MDCSRHRLVFVLTALIVILLLPRPGRAADPQAYSGTAVEASAFSGGTIEYTRAWDYEGPYFAMGASPTTSMRIDGFSPGIRYAAEFGLHWRRGRTVVLMGGEGKVHQILGRKPPGGGLDGVVTLSHRFIYARLGAGVMSGVPMSRDPLDAPPAIGGLVGAGLQGGGHRVVGRIGIDYDVRVDTTGRFNQTVLVNLCLVFGV
jgi:hypothetical protein